jgi:methionyl aminopeptidase
MINGGTGDVKTLEDGWTEVTADHRLSAHWEHTIAIFSGRTEILTEPVCGEKIDPQ